MRNHEDSSHDMANLRRREIASIFAAGILRIHTRQALPTSASPAEETEPDFGADGLEVPEETVLTVHTS